MVVEASGMGQDQSSAKDRDYDFVIDISNTKVNKGKWPCYLNHKHIQHLREYLKKDDTHQDERPHVIKKVEPVILGERIEAAIDDFLLQSGQVDIVSVIGGYKTGKTFLLNMLFDINLPVGVTIASKTQGLSFKLPGTRPGHNHVLLDTGSLGAPVEGNSIMCIVGFKELDMTGSHESQLYGAYISSY